MKILVVDDDPASRRLLKVYLMQAGHETVEAEDGALGFAAFQRESVRLVITDWMMPRLDGPSLINQIRAAQGDRYVYIVMLTALGDKPQVVTGLEAGADDYLTKPFDPEELMARLTIAQRILDLEARLTDQRREMERLAMHDSLTGLLNRRAAQSRALAELNRLGRSGGPLSVLLLDLDHFKAVNDRYGHAVGDQALCLVARHLTEAVRSYDLVGRWGGEEFLVVLPGDDLPAALAVAERIRTRIAQADLALQDGEPVLLQASLGVATVEFSPGDHARASHDGVWDQLVHEADQALYRAKENGRNRVSGTPAMLQDLEAGR